ncbi:MAG TPA: thioredoxin-dependent thiol peroxidase [archaeon]|nr:thioredoxin-dependent thiol peroxidase [archaeon]
MLKTGSRAPDFSLKDQKGKLHKLFDYKGQWVLVYFYPKDDTPGCTKEACSIRYNFPAFKKAKLNVLGISVDSVESHEKFAKKYSLPFTLLSDKNKTAVKKYGVWGKKKFLGVKYEGTNRTSFLIDPKGKIAKTYEKVKPAEHAKEVLEDIASLANKK